MQTLKLELTASNFATLEALSQVYNVSIGQLCRTLITGSTNPIDEAVLDGAIKAVHIELMKAQIHLICQKGSTNPMRRVVVEHIEKILERHRQCTK